MSAEANIRALAEAARAGRYYASTTCRICGRPLRRLAQRAKGYGPDCEIRVRQMCAEIDREELAEQTRSGV